MKVNCRGFGSLLHQCIVTGVGSAVLDLLFGSGYKMSLEGPTTRHNQVKIKPLLVIGGQSSRMGTAKHLLKFPDGRTALEHAIDTLRAAFPENVVLYLSLRNDEQFLSIKDIIPPLVPDPVDAVELDIGVDAPHSDDDEERLSLQYTALLIDGGDERIGPASALQAAYNFSPTSTWFVLGCDYPLLPASAILQLIMEYNEPASCFMQREESGKEWMEPLISIWGPVALEAMSKAIAEGNTGPIRTLKQVKATEVWPLRSEWIKGANTPEEWRECLEILDS